MAFKGLVLTFARDASGIKMSLVVGTACWEEAILLAGRADVGELALNSEVRVVVKEPVSIFKGDTTGMEDTGAAEKKFPITSELNAPGRPSTVVFKVTPAGKELFDFRGSGFASIKLALSFEYDATGRKVSVSFKDIRAVKGPYVAFEGEVAVRGWFVISEGVAAIKDVPVTFECETEGGIAGLLILVTLGKITVGTVEGDALISESIVIISCCTAIRELVVTFMRDDAVEKTAFAVECNGATIRELLVAVACCAALRSLVLLRGLLLFGNVLSM